QPVFDIEGFLLGQPLIFADGRGSAHHVDGVDVEFAGNAGGGLVLGEGEHADARHEIDHGVGIAHGRRVVVFAAVVIGLVVDTVGGDLVGKAGNHGVHIRIGRIEVDHQRADLGAQEMVGAGGAQS